MQYILHLYCTSVWVSSLGFQNPFDGTKHDKTIYEYSRHELFGGILTNFLSALSVSLKSMLQGSDFLAVFISLHVYMKVVKLTILVIIIDSIVQLSTLMTIISHRKNIFE